MDIDKRQFRYCEDSVDMVTRWCGYRYIGHGVDIVKRWCGYR